MLKKNLDALREHAPNLLRWLETGGSDGPSRPNWLQLIHTENNRNLLVHDGVRLKVLYAHDLSDCSPLNTEHALKENASVLVGIGLGHALDRLLRVAEEGHRVVVVEPCAWLVCQAFEKYDFSNALRNNYLRLSRTRDDVACALSVVEEEGVEEWHVAMEPYVRYRGDYLQLSIHVTETINQLRCNTGTIVGSGAKMAQNDIANLPYALRPRGVCELINLFRGKPAITVSTGPSLTKNIHLLQGMQDKAIIIAVGQALRPLLAWGVRPDFICSVDFGEVNMEHYRGLLGSDIPMVALNKMYTPLLRAYAGPKFISASVQPLPGTTAYEVLGGKGELAAGGSVAHMCWSLAAALGCDPLIMIGQDLAYESTTSHTPLADAGGTVQLDGNGQLEWKVHDPNSPLRDEGVLGMGSAQHVPGYYGGSVLSNTGLVSFIKTFEGMFQYHRGKIINATEGGARLRYAEPMPLCTALREYCPEVIDKSVLEPLLTDADDANVLVERAIPLLERDVDLLESIEEHAKKGVAYARAMLRAKTKTKRASMGRHNTHHAQAAYSAAAQLPAVGLSIHGAALTIKGREYKQPKEDELENEEALARGVKRSTLILEAANEAVQRMKKTTEAALKTLTQSQFIPEVLLPIGDTDPPDTSKAREYFESGNWAWPLLTARKCGDTSVEQEALNMKEAARAEAERVQRVSREEKRPQLALFWWCIDRAQEAGRSGDFEDALGELLRANEQLPEYKESLALQGIATAKHMLCLYEEALKDYDTLVETHPHNARYVFERGQVRVLVGDGAGALDDIKNAMRSSGGEFDHFLGILARLCAEQGMLDAALEAYETHLQAHPHDTRARAEYTSLLNE